MKCRLYLTILPSGSRNIANVRKVPEIRGDFARLYLENGKSYEKCRTGAKSLALRL